MRISIVRPAPHWSTSRSTPWQKSADKTAPVSACVRLCSTAKKSPTSASRRTIPTVAQRAIFFRRFWLMLDQRAAFFASYRSWRRIGEWPCQCLTPLPSISNHARPVNFFLKTTLSVHLKEFFSFLVFRFLFLLHRRPRLVAGRIART